MPAADALPVATWLGPQDPGVLRTAHDSGDGLHPPATPATPATVEAVDQDARDGDR